MRRTEILVRFVWPPILISAILGALAAFSVIVQQAWIAPSLASAVFSQLLHPDDRSSHPANIAFGQIIGVAAGMTAVTLAGQTHAPRLMGDHDLVEGRAAAIAIAALLASFFQAVTGKKTPAGGATALVVAIGIESVTWMGAFRMLVGIALVTVLGEAARRWLDTKRISLDLVKAETQSGSSHR